MTVEAGIDQGSTPVEEVAPTTPETAGAGTVDDGLANSFLKDVPELERPIVEKYVKQWDANVTKKFQEVHSEYADFKPFREAGVDPETLSQSYALIQALETDPQGTIQAIAQAYKVSFGEAAEALGLTPQQGQVGTPQQQQLPAQQQQPVGDLDPRIQHIEQLATTTAQLILQQQEQQQQIEADKALDSEIKTLSEKYGNFDERYVLTLGVQLGDLEEAVKAYKTWENQVLAQANTPNAPVVLGAGGGLPSSDINPAKLNDKETKALVTQLLQKAQQEQ